uniref:Cytochrome b5 n=1 Tax=Timema shepardi TaxID=629360 RepID=A0A7R9ALY3_TIMSH|nr:unnamed protein product [Timema shepardi]
MNLRGSTEPTECRGQRTREEDGEEEKQLVTTWTQESGFQFTRPRSTEIRTLISPSSAVELNTTSTLANYATEYPAMGDPKLYKRDEVAKENNGETTLMIIHNSVYNVTAYLKEHPGGEEVLLEQGGKDATEAFEDVGHSLDARDLMDNYKVGELVPEDRLKKLSKKEAWHLDGCVLKAYFVPIVTHAAETWTMNDKESGGHGNEVCEERVSHHKEKQD